MADFIKHILKRIFTIFSICIIAFSCKKSDLAQSLPVSPYSNTGEGSVWVYEVKTQHPATVDTTTVFDTCKVISGDTTISSRRYSRIAHNDGSHSYYNTTGNDYYQFHNIAGLDTVLEALYLKDNVTAGTSWSQNVNVDIGVGFLFNIEITYRVIETGATKTVFGKTYDDVITIRTEMDSPGMPFGLLVADITNSYARNVGSIQENYNVDVSIPGGVHIHTQTALKYADPH